MASWEGDLFRNLSLLENVAGTQLQIFLPHTVIFRKGVLHSWFYSNAHGVITRCNPEQLDFRRIQNKFAESMHQNPGNSCFVATAYNRAGKPQLLRRHGFTELCNALERQMDTAVDSRCSVDVPDVIQSYVQPLLDATYTTTYHLNGGVPTVDTLQSTWSCTVEEPPPAEARRPSAPMQPVPSAPTQISSALKRRLRQIALSLAAHFRSSRRDSSSFTFHCLRDARSRFCITAMYQRGDTTLSGEKHTISSHLTSPFSESVRQGSLGSHRQTVCSRDETCSDMDLSRCTQSHSYSLAPSLMHSSEHSRTGVGTGVTAVRRPRSANPTLAKHGDSQSLRCSSKTRPRSAMAGACRTVGNSYRADQCRSVGGKQDSPAVHRQPMRVSRDNISEVVDRRGVPRVLDSLVSELETMRGDLVFQHKVIESHSRRANKAEGELEAVQSTCDARLQSMQAKLEAATAELTTLRAEHRVSAQQAATAKDRARSLESQVKELTGMVDSERATTIKALSQYQNREGELVRRLQTLEAELSNAKESLKQEQAAVVAMKNQTVSLSDELQQVHKEYPPRTIADAGILDILASISQLLAKESNPAGERYAVQKVVISYSMELRATFLFYCQLDSSFAQHWPPSMMQHQFLAFCRDSETVDLRAGARGRGSSAGMLPISEAQEAFEMFANNEDGARDYASLPYEGFVCALIQLSSRLKSHTASFLSEAFRSYILRHVHKAKKVQPSVPRSAKATGMSPGTIPSAQATMKSKTKRRT